MTIGGACVSLIQDPLRLLVRRWSWKSALLSPLFRSQIFLAVNLRAGWSRNRRHGRRIRVSCLGCRILRLADTVISRREPAWLGEADAETFAGLLGSVMADPERRRRKTEAARATVEQCRWPSVTSRYLRVY
jgi:hypothetical protein